LRPDSGGRGKHKGGNGVIRRTRFLEAMHAAILSNHRRTVPFGLNGGESGKVGRNRVERHTGYIERSVLPASMQLEVGDAVVIEMPGGGRYGQDDDWPGVCRT